MAVIPPSRDPRLVGYGVLTIGLLAVALVTGLPALAAGALPFVVVLIMGLRDTAPREIDVSVATSTLTPLEGDDVTLTIVVPREPGVVTHVEMELGPAWGAEDRDQLHLVAPPDGSDAVLTVVAQPKWWGRTSAGAVLVTHRDPEGLVIWEQRTTVDAVFRCCRRPPRCANCCRRRCRTRSSACTPHGWSAMGSTSPNCGRTRTATGSATSTGPPLPATASRM
ncbi:MAG: hypothetical protein R2694_15170 [Ilumatobacteraceae bacterium]